MLVYVVMDNTEDDLCGVFSTQQKALEIVDKIIEKYRDVIDIGEKHRFARSKDEWSQTFYYPDREIDLTLYCIMIDRIA